MFNLSESEVASVHLDPRSFCTTTGEHEETERWGERQKYSDIWVGMELTDGNHSCSRKADWGRERFLNQIQGCGVKLCHNFWVLMS